MLLDQKVKVKWHNKSKNHYIKLGYVFTKMHEEFEANAHDLSENSRIIVKVKCDYCGDIIEKKYQAVSSRKNEKDSCKKCTSKKIIEKKIKNGNSLGDKHPEIIKFWSNKNKISPFDITYGSNIKVWWICNNNHEWFAKLPFENDLNCPRCNKDSTGEKEIAKILIKNNVSFKNQYSFKNLLNENNNQLKFDFAIFKEDKLYCLIEFDGRQHYQPVFGEDVLKTTKYRDGLKNKYCEENNISLIRIPFWDFENLNQIVSNIIGA